MTAPDLTAPKSRAMRALSLWRPWPYAFFHCGKRVENRSWAPPKSILGEWVAIHAAMKFDGEAWLEMRRGRFGPEAREVPHNDPPHDHPLGIVGAMRIGGYYDIETRAGVHWKAGIFRATEDPVWAFGPYCWMIDCVVELAAPIPCKGAQGLWAVPPEIEAEVRRQIAAAYLASNGEVHHG